MNVQRNWDARAAANFMGGGCGAGLLIFTALVERPAPWAIALSLALVAAGLGAVWLEIGKPLRALNVYFNPFTSWMSRESFAAVVLFVAGGAALVYPDLIFVAALAALAFLWCQARLLQAAKGIPAWRARETVALIVTTGLAEGAGLGLLFDAGPLATTAFALALAARAIAWLRYRRAVKSAALEPAGKALLGVGTVAALVLLLASAPLAGLAAFGSGWYLKFALVTRASLKQGFALPRLPVRGTR
ncbi:MAG TPA: hypothetical protein VGJ74_00930 [Burkholderiales bacterium]